MVDFRAIFFFGITAWTVCLTQPQGFSSSGLGAIPGNLGSVGALNPVAPINPFQPSAAPRGRGQPGPLDAGLRSPAPAQLSAELLVLIDKKARDEWVDKMSGGSPQEKEARADRAMDEFINSVLFGVNELYASLGRYGIFLDIRLVDSKQINDLWTKDSLLEGTEDQIPANKAIDLFYDWSWRNRRALPGFDHLMLLTGYDIVDHLNASKPTTGVAYKGVMCKFGSISVVENTFTYQLVHDVAHELGHSLGCDHDGENNSCNENDGFIMSVRPEVNSTNRWYFSPCSAEAIREDLASLDRDNANCLRGTRAEKTVAPQLGTLLNADKQCQFLFGDDAYFCRDFYTTSDDYHHLCTSLWCSETHNASQCVSHIASDGFLCGDSMICSKGQCIKVEGAPQALDTCPQGDQPGIVHDGMTCEEIVRLRPWSCYDDFYRKKCCVACPGISKAVPDCEFGDREDWCQDEQMKYPYDCYLNNQTCCESCAELLNDSNIDCEYGDHSYECVTDLDIPLGCYGNDELCCQSCANHKNASAANCEYGDKSTWCSEQLEVPSGCYLNEDLCCATCSQHKRAESDDCPYGDRYPKWCPTVTPYRCYNETVRGWCCDSCKGQFNVSTEGCEYGDKFENCQDLIYPYACYHPTNEEACCGFCSVYKTEENEDCKYGDKQAWCWKLTLTYEEQEWCPLDEENDHCCGTCRFNSTAVPVFGYRLREEGLEQVTRLGEQFRQEVKQAILEKKKEEAEKKAREEEEASKEGENVTDGQTGGNSTTVDVDSS